MKKITATVELYNGLHKEKVEIEITDEDLRELAARKAFDSYSCISCETVGVEITVSA